MLVHLFLLASPTGAPDCPCIDPWAAGNIILNNNAPRAANVSDCDWERLGDRVCYSRSYGASGCLPYDAETSACMGAEPPSWCAAEWCYVDPNNCRRPHEVSAYFSDVRITNPEASSGTSGECMPSQQIQFSYQTCGFLDSFTSSADGALAQV